MSLRYKQKMIENVVAEGVEQEDANRLLDFLLNVVGKIAPTLARRADFNLRDFANMRRFGLEEFSLTLRTDNIGGTLIWNGEFVSGTRRVRAMVSLED